MAKSKITDTQIQAEKIANGTKSPGQTKAQTKLISQGIEKGIAEYKKQQKAKARTIEKDKKKQTKEKNALNEQNGLNSLENNAVGLKGKASFNKAVLVPWLMLALTWYGIAYYYFT